MQVQIVRTFRWEAASSESEYIRMLESDGLSVVQRIAKSDRNGNVILPTRIYTRVKAGKQDAAYLQK
ncbi:hypothetical protein Tco_0565563 [Tanacetum coccineum]